MRQLVLVVAWAFVASVNSAAAQSAGGQDLPVQTVQTFITANERADLPLMMTTFADDATVFMPGEPAKRLSGSAAIRDAFSALFAARRGPIVITPADVQVQMLGEIAIVTAHLVRPLTAPGTSRRTFVLRKIGDRWQIVHLHASNLQPTGPG
jgi:ketosteroid isomerase-like protein